MMRSETMRQSYIETIQQWRQQMEEALRADDGWLTLAGLFWLHPGTNTIGADTDSDIMLPAGFAPDQAASIEFAGDRATLHALPDVEITVNGQPASTNLLRSDAEPPADLVRFGDLSFQIIQRGSRYGVRVRNRRHPDREAFAGRRWFPIQAAYQVPGSFTPYDLPQPRQTINILGDITEELSPGFVSFTLDGQHYRLEASPTRADELFLVFRDLTAGKTTYPAGRFLKVPRPRNPDPSTGPSLRRDSSGGAAGKGDGETIIDFNKAYNPPCAFTPFATCPLPSPQNRLGIPIPAGELYEHE
jgi:uncharacterized protein (DUF1684 family)